MIRNGNVRAVTDSRAAGESAPVYVTGIGIVSAFGDSRDSFRDALLAGKTGITPSAYFESQGCRSILTAPVSNFDPARWISPMKLRRMDGTGPYALVATRQAMEDARYPVAAEGDDRAGVVLGTYSAGGQASHEYLEAFFRGGPTGAPALLFNSTVANAAAGLVGLEYQLRGPNATISQKEASGLAALATAVDVIRGGRADAMMAGGMDGIYELFYKAHDRFRVMNAARSFSSAVAPFDRCRRGFVMGEGGFGLWLERGDRWRERGARSYGEILGVGAASAALPLNAWPDRPEPLVRTMALALDDARLKPDDVDIVYASANASRVLDETEASALTQLFGNRPVVTSIKGALGECGASGSAASAAALLCGVTGRVPPVSGLADVDLPARDLRLATTAVDAPGPIVLVNSFASGGALYSCVVRVNR
jgi:3-oxoacyl-[acyl-carrier-protein] synthase II